MIKFTIVKLIWLIIVVHCYCIQVFSKKRRELEDLYTDPTLRKQNGGGISIQWRLKRANSLAVNSVLNKQVRQEDYNKVEFLKNVPKVRQKRGVNDQHIKDSLLKDVNDHKTIYRKDLTGNLYKRDINLQYDKMMSKKNKNNEVDSTNILSKKIERRDIAFEKDIGLMDITMQMLSKSLQEQTSVDEKDERDDLLTKSIHDVIKTDSLEILKPSDKKVIRIKKSLKISSKEGMIQTLRKLIKNSKPVKDKITDILKTNETRTKKVVVNIFGAKNESIDLKQLDKLSKDILISDMNKSEEVDRVVYNIMLKIHDKDNAYSNIGTIVNDSTIYQAADDALIKRHFNESVRENQENRNAKRFMNTTSQMELEDLQATVNKDDRKIKLKNVNMGGKGYVLMDLVKKSKSVKTFLKSILSSDEIKSKNVTFNLMSELPFNKDPIQMIKSIKDIDIKQINKNVNGSHIVYDVMLKFAKNKIVMKNIEKNDASPKNSSTNSDFSTNDKTAKSEPAIDKPTNISLSETQLGALGQNQPILGSPSKHAIKVTNIGSRGQGYVLMNVLQKSDLVKSTLKKILRSKEAKSRKIVANLLSKTNGLVNPKKSIELAEDVKIDIVNKTIDGKRIVYDIVLEPGDNENKVTAKIRKKRSLLEQRQHGFPKGFRLKDKLHHLTKMKRRSIPLNQKWMSDYYKLIFGGVHKRNKIGKTIVRMSLKGLSKSENLFNKTLKHFIHNRPKNNISLIQLKKAIKKFNIQNKLRFIKKMISGHTRKHRIPLKAHLPKHNEKVMKEAIYKKRLTRQHKQNSHRKKMQFKMRAFKKSNENKQSIDLHTNKRMNLVKYLTQNNNVTVIDTGNKSVKEQLSEILRPLQSNSVVVILNRQRGKQNRMFQHKTFKISPSMKKGLNKHQQKIFDKLLHSTNWQNAQKRVHIPNNIKGTYPTSEIKRKYPTAYIRKDVKGYTKSIKNSNETKNKNLSVNKTHKSYDYILYGFETTPPPSKKLKVLKLKKQQKGYSVTNRITQRYAAKTELRNILSSNSSGTDTINLIVNTTGRKNLPSSSQDLLRVTKFLKFSMGKFEGNSSQRNRTHLKEKIHGGLLANDNLKTMEKNTTNAANVSSLSNKTNNSVQEMQNEMVNVSGMGLAERSMLSNFGITDPVSSDTRNTSNCSSRNKTGEKFVENDECGLAPSPIDFHTENPTNDTEFIIVNKTSTFEDQNSKSSASNQNSKDTDFIIVKPQESDKQNFVKSENNDDDSDENVEKLKKKSNKDIIKKSNSQDNNDNEFEYEDLDKNINNPLDDFIADRQWKQTSENEKFEQSPIVKHNITQLSYNNGLQSTSNVTLTGDNLMDFNREKNNATPINIESLSNEFDADGEIGDLMRLLTESRYGESFRKVPFKTTDQIDDILSTDDALYDYLIERQWIENPNYLFDAESDRSSVFIPQERKKIMKNSTKTNEGQSTQKCSGIIEGNQEIKIEGSSHSVNCDKPNKHFSDNIKEIIPETFPRLTNAKRKNETKKVNISSNNDKLSPAFPDTRNSNPIKNANETSKTNITGEFVLNSVNNLPQNISLNKIPSVLDKGSGLVNLSSRLITNNSLLDTPISDKGENFNQYPNFIGKTSSINNDLQDQTSTTPTESNSAAYNTYNDNDVSISLQNTPSTNNLVSITSSPSANSDVNNAPLLNKENNSLQLNNMNNTSKSWDVPTTSLNVDDANSNTTPFTFKDNNTEPTGSDDSGNNLTPDNLKDMNTNNLLKVDTLKPRDEDEESNAISNSLENSKYVNRAADAEFSASPSNNSDSDEPSSTPDKDSNETKAVHNDTSENKTLSKIENKTMSMDKNISSNTNNQVNINKADNGNEHTISSDHFNIKMLQKAASGQSEEEIYKKVAEEEKRKEGKTPPLDSENNGTKNTKVKAKLNSQLNGSLNANSGDMNNLAPDNKEESFKVSESPQLSKLNNNESSSAFSENLKNKNNDALSNSKLEAGAIAKIPSIAIAKMKEQLKIDKNSHQIDYSFLNSLPSNNSKMTGNNEPISSLIIDELLDPSINNMTKLRTSQTNVTAAIKADEAFGVRQNESLGTNNVDLNAWVENRYAAATAGGKYGQNVPWQGYRKKVAENNMPSRDVNAWVESRYAGISSSPGQTQQGIVGTGFIQPVNIRPSLPPPRIVGLGLTQPGIVSSGRSQQGVVNPALTKQVIVGPGLTKQGIVGPGLTKQGIVGPGLSKQGIVGPGLTKQGIVGPGLTKQGIVGPSLTKQGIVGPTLTQQRVIGLGFSKPQIMRPGTTLQGAVIPGFTKQGVARPGLVQQRMVGSTIRQSGIIRSPSKAHQNLFASSFAQKMMNRRTQPKILNPVIRQKWIGVPGNSRENWVQKLGRRPSIITNYYKRERQNQYPPSWQDLKKLWDRKASSYRYRNYYKRYSSLGENIHYHTKRHLSVKRGSVEK